MRLLLTSPTALIVGCTLLGLVLRLGQLGYSYGSDDFQNVPALSGSFPSMWDWIVHGNYLPVYWLITHAWSTLGQGEAFMRIPGIVFGISLIPAIYTLGKELFSQRVGLIGALLTAISPFMIEQSSQIKPHTLMALLAALLTLLTLGWLRTNKIACLMGYLACAILGMYTHYHIALILLALNIYTAIFLLKTGRHRLWAWGMAQVVVVLAFLPWLPIALKQASVPVGPANLLTALPELAITFSVGYSAIQFTTLSIDKVIPLAEVIDNIPMMIAFLLVYGSVTVIGIGRALKAGFKGFLLLLGLFVPIMAAFCLSFFIPGMITAKYLIGSAVFYYILLAIAVVGWSKSRLGIILLAGMILLNSYSLFNYYFRDTEFGRKENFRGLVDYVLANKQKGDVLVAGAGIDGVEYYFPPSATALGPVDITELDNASTQTSMDTSLQNSQRVWLVYRVREDSDPNGSWISGRSRLEQSFQLEQEKRFNPMLVLYLYKRAVP
jgi:4-amino-4-deoxy-L-arabinose transferase-like glycosyltransferase